jgi:2-keto-4-pentenoate hydratase/2-oxohepta-3-ene-1,7-dioic acid hydratase in catechol pathway
MKFCRFELHNEIHYGLIEALHGREMIVGTCDPFAPDAAVQRFGDPISFENARLHAPVLPSKIVCVGRNYREHAKELGNEVPAELLIFLKPPSSVIGPGATIVRPRLSQRVDHESELGVVIGKRCRNVAREAARDVILGYTCLNDVTARDLQKKDGQWTRGKGFDTFCPVGPAVVSGLDPWAGIGVECRVNGQVRQTGTTSDFVFPLDEIIRYVSQIMTLEPGDLIATGTPSGVGPLVAGDRVEVVVEGVGILSNSVADE